MYLKKNNIELKQLNKKYLNSNYLDWFNDPLISKFINHKPKDVDDLKNYYYKTLQKKELLFGIFYKKKHIGNLKVHDLNFSKSSAYLGLFIGTDKYRSKNIGSTSIDLIKDYLFYKKKINTIFLGVDKKNYKAINFYYKNKFYLYKKKKKNLIMYSNFFYNKLIVGTAQFESNYGVTNLKLKKLDNLELKEIIKFLSINNIYHYDHAFDYSFKIRKNFITKNTIIDNKILTNTEISFDHIKKKLLKLKKQKQFTFNTMYIHDGDNIFSRKGRALFNFLKTLKAKKLIKNIGISLYNLKKINSIIKSCKLDVIQFPYSIVDKRLESKINLIKKNNIKIVVRSLFLQGSLLRNVKSHKLLSSIYNEAERISEKYNADILSICLNYVFNNRNIDKFIIGVRSKKELQSILKKKIVPRSYSLNFSKNLINKVVDPRKWNK